MITKRRLAIAGMVAIAALMVVAAVMSFIDLTS